MFPPFLLPAILRLVLWPMSYVWDVSQYGVSSVSVFRFVGCIVVFCDIGRERLYRVSFIVFLYLAFFLYDVFLNHSLASTIYSVLVTRFLCSFLHAKGSGVQGTNGFYGLSAVALIDPTFCSLSWRCSIVTLFFCDGAVIISVVGLSFRFYRFVVVYDGWDFYSRRFAITSMFCGDPNG